MSDRLLLLLGLVVYNSAQAEAPPPAAAGAHSARPDIGIRFMSPIIFDKVLASVYLVITSAGFSDPSTL